MIRLKNKISLLVMFSLFLGILPFDRQATVVRAETELVTRARDEAAKNEPKGLRFRLSEGAEQPEQQSTSAVAPAVKLSESDTARVLARLPALGVESGDEQEFAMRERSLPAPRTGKVINVNFPAAEGQRPPDVSSAGGALDVLRHAPEGEITLAPQLSLTFSQPMVAVTSMDELAAADVPVRLTPQPPGKWRWVGTKTLLFVPEGRFPMATEYRVTVPAGTKSANGGALPVAKSWSFATPAPVVKRAWPDRNNGSQRRDAVMFIEFDQRIDAARVLQNIHVSVAGSELKIRMATEAEVAADEAVSRLAGAAEKGRWLAFRAVDAATNDVRTPLPANSLIDVSVARGTPSAEGPRTTPQAQNFSFLTYGPLQAISQNCEAKDKCSPTDWWYVSFSNPLDAAAFQKSQVKVEPAITGMKTNVNGTYLMIDGIKPGRRTYKVTLDASIKDQFGQTLEGNRSFTFHVGAAEKSLTAAGEGFIVLDPNAAGHYSVFSVNHSKLKVRLYSVGPENWNQFVNYMRYSQGYADENAKKNSVIPGKLITTKTIDVASKPDEMVETQIDLSPGLSDGVGQVFVIVEPAVWMKPDEREDVKAWVQVTNIGLDAFVDNTDLMGWATSLKDGRPLEGVLMEVQPGGNRATSGADGLARIALKDKTQSGANILVARRGRDTAILPERTEWYFTTEGGWFRREALDALRWYVFDDRKMYRPGEEVHLKGWLRKVGGKQTGDVGALDGAATGVNYILYDSRGNEVGKGSMQINALGGFDTAFKLPGTMNLGYASLQLTATGGDGSGTERATTHSFQVQEFRRPEFEVKAQTASEAPFFVGGSADAFVTAAYYAGGGLPNTDVTWNVTATPTSYTPPNRSDYTFGKWIPWWVKNAEESESRTQTFTGKTDASGKHRLHIDFDGVNPPRPTSVRAEASVMDVNRQAFNSSTTLLVHPADLYVGLKSERTFVEQGQPLVVQSIVTDLDGKAIENRTVKMRAELLDWVYENDTWQQKATGAQSCSVQSGKDAVQCTFDSKEGGEYRITATVMDDRERFNESEFTLWVAGGKQPPKRGVEQETVNLIPDRKDYQPNDVAEILVQAPFYPAEGVLTLRRSGLVKTERFKMESSSLTLKIPIAEGYTPNVHVQVDLNGAAVRLNDEGKANDKLPKRPAFASGELSLSIPPLARKLNVVATPREKALEPNGETSVDVSVKDAHGEPVANSEVAVVVVDESVLALSGYRIEDPLNIFYAQRDSGTSDFHMRSSVVLADPEALAKRPISRGVLGGNADMISESVTVTARPMASPRARREVSAMKKDGGDAEDKAAFRVVTKSGEEPEHQEAIRVRENFNALAVFSPAVPTDGNGRAVVHVKVPDNLTRYRIMAVSVAGGKQFGAGESSLTARQPLMVRPSAPRFLNFGDRFELPVVLQNQTDAQMSVDVAVRATNAELTDGAGRRVIVPANDRVEVRLPVAAGRAGTARFQVGAASGRFADAAELSLPVWTPATTEAFATYGEIDDGAIVQPVKAPRDVFKQFGGLEVTTSSTQLQELTDAVVYLMAYPYECAEQISSRVMGVAALKDVLAAFQAKGLPKPEEMKAAVARDIKKLRSLQNPDGGFAFWKRGDESWPYISIHVAHALQRAKEKGFDVPSEMLDQSKDYLRKIEQHIPHYYSIQSRRALISYALYVRNRMNDRDTTRARKLIAEAKLENLSLESVGWLLSVLSGDAKSGAEVEAIRHHLNNRVSETAGLAHFTDSYTDGDYLLLHSSRRADGVILESLIKDQPNSDLIPKIVRGLLAHRTAGRWENTQENVFILLALDRYFNTYEKVTPDFVARAWLGNQFAGEQNYRGRTTESQRVNIPMRYLAEKGGTENLTLSKEGAGRLYYRIGMQYAPVNLKLAAADYGFAVERVYEAVDNPSDVRRDKDGTWHIKAGARVRVRLTMSAPSRRYHVALVDPMPAGLESLNPELATTGTIPQDQKENDRKGGYWWWYRSWYEHQNFRDERAEAFTSLLWEGVYNYSYVARATTPGHFVVPPAKAEEMYHPETFGRGASDRVVVE